MAKTVSGADGERWDPVLQRYVPTDFRTRRAKDIPKGGLNFEGTIKDGPLRIFRRKPKEK